ncbi:MAG TPA: alpha/beta hydrolase [Polyangiaceae bacterium LLY-WYZ-14_1]|nr:alpha/beta hydrolase [Polyangiaceae bacterium LLY-WYZ-14_1]
MILRTEQVDQTIDGDDTVTLVKDVVLTPGSQPLGMVRKRLPAPAVTRGAVLLVHGFGQNRYTWHSSRRSFSAFLAARGWDVFNLDLRGQGRSRRFGATRADVLDDHVREDLPACAEEAARLSGHERMFFIGHSMGGLISYGAAATLRPRVRGICTIGSPYRFGVGVSPILFFLATLAGAIRVTGVFDGNPAVPLRLLGRALRTQRRLWDTKGLPLPIRGWVPGTIEAEVLEEYLNRAFDRTSLALAFDILRSGRQSALRSHDGQIDYGLAFETLDRPLLVIAGSEDHLAPPDSVKPAYERSRSADKAYRVFPFGHLDLLVAREASSTVWATIASWLDRR